VRSSAHQESAALAAYKTFRNEQFRDVQRDTKGRKDDRVMGIATRGPARTDSWGPPGNAGDPYGGDIGASLGNSAGLGMQQSSRRMWVRISPLPVSLRMSQGADAADQQTDKGARRGMMRMCPRGGGASGRGISPGGLERISFG
jgi:hypothetical protein